MQEFTVTAPTRIDLAGGTLDLWPLHRMFEATATVNVALDLCARTSVRRQNSGIFTLRSSDQQLSCSGNFREVLAADPLPLHRLILRSLWSANLPAVEVLTSCQSPQGAGLGGSSSLTITLVRALGQAQQALHGVAPLAGAALVACAQDIEATCLHTPTGIQDYWAAVNGGITLISYPPGAAKVRKLPLTSLPELSHEVLICYSGRSRLSGINNWQIFKAVIDNDSSTRAHLEAIGQHSQDAYKAVEQGDWQLLLESSHCEWQVRRQLSAGIETDETRAIDKAACSAGAYFTRICGAGGGGVMALFVPAEKRSQVAAAAEKAGGQILAAQFTEQGAQ